jgi:hypothetical protein
MDALDHDLADVKVLGRTLRLLDVLARPDAAKAVAAELLDAAVKVDGATEQAKHAVADLESKQAAVLAALTEARQSHDEKLRADRRELADQTSSRDAALREREAAVSSGEKQLANDRQQVESMRTDLAARLAALNAAADPRPFPRAVGSP